MPTAKKKTKRIPVRIAAQAWIGNDTLASAQVTLFVGADQVGPLRDVLMAVLASRSKPSTEPRSEATTTE